MNNVIIMALVATLGTWFVTMLGAATVVFFKSTDTKLLNPMLGFAAGVMIAASYFSLLSPAIALADEISAIPSYIVASLGFVSGAIFMWMCDALVTHFNKNQCNYPFEYTKNSNRIFMLILSITLHNIPEGLAVGVAFGALKGMTPDFNRIMGAVTIAVGIALQNFPEGAAVSVPLRREGYSRKKAFFLGQASGMVEPLAGVAGAMLVVYTEAILPYALSFAAGTMILVAVHELIPECQRDNSSHPYLSTMGIISGFALMMLLDVMLG